MTGKYSAASIDLSLAKLSPPNALMALIGVQIRIPLDSRLKHAGMTDFGHASCRE
jgi:hypothetical protein